MSATTASHARWSGRGDSALGLGQQRTGDPGAAVTCADVDLLDLVVDHHHEAGQAVIGDRDSRVAHSASRPRLEGLPQPRGEQDIGNPAQVGLPPAVAPDRRDGAHIVAPCSAQGWAGGGIWLTSHAPDLPSERGPAAGLGAVDVGEPVLPRELGEADRGLVPACPVGIGCERGDGATDIAG